MKTKFDHVTDAEISTAANLLGLNGLESASFYESLTSDIEKIACAATSMGRWRCWLGPPVTYYEDSSLEFDGQHRTRACKYLARACGASIQIPLRYSPDYLQEEEEVKQMIHDKEYRAPCSQDCVCSDKPPASCVGDSLCQ